MKRTFTLALALAFLLLAAGHSPAQANDKIGELRKQYIAAVQKAFDLLAAEYKNERRSYEELFEGNLRLLNAKLDAAETAQERVKVHESIVGLMKARETFLNQALKSETVDELRVLNAKADRIKAEIALEQAKDSGVMKLK